MSLIPWQQLFIMKAHRPMMHAINKTLKRRDIGLHSDKQLEAATVCRRSGNTDKQKFILQKEERGTTSAALWYKNIRPWGSFPRVVTSLVSVLESLFIWLALKIMDLLVKMVLVVETTHFQPEASLFFWCKCPVCVCWCSDLHSPWAAELQSSRLVESQFEWSSRWLSSKCVIRHLKWPLFTFSLLWPC